MTYMQSPFPGMDPYLEQSWLWPRVHLGLISALQRHIAPRVRPKYLVAADSRVYLDFGWTFDDEKELLGRPDLHLTIQERSRQYAVAGGGPDVVNMVTAQLPVPEEVTEWFLEIQEVGTRRVITVIEILSPTNKRAGSGRAAYEAKRLQVLGSLTHLIEIDLLRAGPALPPRLPADVAADYRILISRAEDRPKVDVLAFGVRQAIPDFPVPLEAGDPELDVPLNALLHELYDEVGYDLAVDYQRPPVPPLGAEDAAWAEAVVKEWERVGGTEMAPVALA